MIRMIAHLLKLVICIIKHSSVLTPHLRPGAFLFFLRFFLFLSPLRLAQLPPLFQLCVGPPCVMEYQRQPEGLYFSYLSEFYFGGLRGVQCRIPCLTSGSISPLIVLDGGLPFSSHYPGPSVSKLRQLFWGSWKKNQDWTQAGNQQAKEISRLRAQHVCAASTLEVFHMRAVPHMCLGSLSLSCTHWSLLFSFIFSRPPIFPNFPSPLLPTLSLQALLIIRLTSLSNILLGQYSQQRPRRGWAKHVLIKSTRAAR